MNTIKILFFDDEKWSTDILIKNIRDSYSCYQINYFENVEDFFNELVCGIKYDLIIIDIMAPMSLILDNEKVRSQFSSRQIELMKDGLSTGEIFHEKIRNTENYQSIPILFYTAKRATNINDPNTSFLRKPELIKDIHQKIQLMIKK